MPKTPNTSYEMPCPTSTTRTTLADSANRRSRLNCPGTPLQHPAPASPRPAGEGLLVQSGVQAIDTSVKDFVLSCWNARELKLGWIRCGTFGLSKAFNRWRRATPDPLYRP